MAKNNNKPTANNSKSAKAVLVVSNEDLKNNLISCFSKLGANFEEGVLNSFVNSLCNSKWAKETKNGVLKLTDNKPQESEDIKATSKIANVTYYFVPMSKGNTICLSSLRTYTFMDFTKEKIRKAVANLKSFEDWKNNEGKTYVSNLGDELANKFAAGMNFDDIQKEGYTLYKKNVEELAASLEEE